MAQTLPATTYTQTPVVSIDRAQQTITLNDATVIGYQQLVLATGARYTSCH